MTTEAKATKTFTLMEMYSIVDGRLSNAGMDSVYEILGHTSSNPHPFTHELPTLLDEVAGNKPDWWLKVQTDLALVKEKVGDKFEDQMKFIEEQYNPKYTI